MLATLENVLEDLVCHLRWRGSSIPFLFCCDEQPLRFSESEQPSFEYEQSPFQPSTKLFDLFVKGGCSHIIAALLGVGWVPSNHHNHIPWILPVTCKVPPVVITALSVLNAPIFHPERVDEGSCRKV